MPQYQEGQTATHKDGRKIIFQNGQWRNMEGASGGSRPPTPQEQMTLRKAREDARAVGEVRATYGRTAKEVEEFGTDADKAEMFRRMYPGDSVGVLSSIGSAILRNTVGQTYSKEDKDAYQYLQAQQNRLLAETQKEQKGVQTESDALRYKLAEISPDKSVATNMKVIRDGNIRTQIAQEYPRYISSWIAKFGSLSAPAKNGTTFDQGWQNHQDKIRSMADDRGYISYKKNTKPTTARKPAPKGWKVTKSR